MAWSLFKKSSRHTVPVLQGTSNLRGIAPPPVNASAANEVDFAGSSVEARSIGPSLPGQEPQVLTEMKGDADDAIASHFSTFSDVPSSFSHLLSAGEEPMVKLTPLERSQLVVISLGGRSALLVHSDAPSALLEAVHGKVQQHGYTVQVVTAEPEVVTSIYQAGEQLEQSAGSSRTNEWLNTVDEWMRYAVKNGATDVHIERNGKVGKVRFRIHGEMETMRATHAGTYTGVFLEEAMGTLFNNENQSKSGSAPLFHAELNQSCMVPYHKIQGHGLKLRFQSIKGNLGPKVVLRLLPTEADLRVFSFQQQGYADSQIRLFETAQETATGIVLFSGITGSGKSTAFKTFIESNPAAPNMAIYTIEDPIENLIRFTHQIYLQRNLQDPAGSARMYTETISTILRADPDLVGVGEIRDAPSAHALQVLAETGALSAGTLHANQIAIMVPRLVDPEIGLSRSVLTAPGMILLLVYQALVPVLCPSCSETTEAAVRSDNRIAAIASHIVKLDVDHSRVRWRHAGGCEHCKGRGTVGVTVVAEMLMPDDEWLRVVREGRDGDAVEVYRSQSDGDLMSPNMDGKTVFEHTLHKALLGQVDPRQCSRFEPWARFMTRESRRKASRPVALVGVA